MRTEQCYCVLEAVKMGSFTKAADNLFLKQPSLRANINNLEAELGKPLFERSKSGVKLTAFGEYCYPHISNIVKTYELMLNEREWVCRKERPLSVGATRIFSNLLGKSYDLYENQYPGRKCIFFSSASDQEVLQRVIEHKLDLGLISYFPTLWEDNKWFHSQQGHNFEICKIREIKTMAIMRKDHPLARCSELPLQKLEDYLIVFFSDSVAQVQDLLLKVLDSDKKPQMAKVVDEKLWYKYMLEENAISFTLDGSFSGHLNAFQVVPLDDRFIQQAVAIYSSEVDPNEVMGYIGIIKALLKD